MVLARKVGRERSFALGFLLTVVTFGVYAIYWNYRAHNELYRQFELEREGRDEGMVWYVLGLVLQPLLVAYMWIFASNVDYLRRRIGLQRQTTPGKFVLVAGTGVAAIAGSIVLLAVATLGLPQEATQEEVDAALAPYSGGILALFAFGLLLLAIAYRMLQRDINEVWGAYAARMSYLEQHPEEVPHPAMAELAPAVSAAQFAQPLQREVEALRLRHGNLRALPELEELAARAVTGDAEARERAETLLADVAALLEERAALLLVQEEPQAADRLEVVEAALFHRDEPSAPTRVDAREPEA